MKILILEDNYDRITSFMHRLIGAEVKTVDTVEDCITALKHDKWDALFLDHDLGGKIYQTENTGEDVTKWLKDNPQYIPPSVFIHSLNYGGAERMKGHIPQAVIAPFLWNTVELRNTE